MAIAFVSARALLLLQLVLCLLGALVLLLDRNFFFVLVRVPAFAGIDAPTRLRIPPRDRAVCDSDTKQLAQPPFATVVWVPLPDILLIEMRTSKVSQ